MPPPAPGTENGKEERTSDDGPGIRLGLRTGASYLSMSGFRGFSTFIAPELSWQMSPRFFITAGVRADQCFPTGGIYSSGEMRAGSVPATSFLLYASGTYLLRSNLSVTGSVLKNISSTGSLPPFVRNYRYVPDQYSIRMDYQITPSIHFGAEFRYMNYQGSSFLPGGNPYLMHW